MNQSEQSRQRALNSYGQNRGPSRQWEEAEREKEWQKPDEMSWKQYDQFLEKKRRKMEMKENGRWHDAEIRRKGE